MSVPRASKVLLLYRSNCGMFAVVRDGFHKGTPGLLGSLGLPAWCGTWQSWRPVSEWAARAAALPQAITLSESRQMSPLRIIFAPLRSLDFADTRERNDLPVRGANRRLCI